MLSSEGKWSDPRASNIPLKLLIFSSVVLVAALMACAPADKVPMSGNIAMEYVDAVPPNGGVSFSLANGTSGAIHLLGNPDPAPSKLLMTCSLPTNEAIAYGQGSFDPPEKFKIIEVRPGERLHLHLWTILPTDFKSGKSRCQLELNLEGGGVVESREFVP